MNVLRPRYDCIPNELKTRNQWVCWLLKKVEHTNGKPPKKPFTVMIVTKNILPAVPAYRHMIDGTRKFNPEMSWHARNLPCFRLAGKP